MAAWVGRCCRTFLLHLLCLLVTFIPWTALVYSLFLPWSSPVCQVVKGPSNATEIVWIRPWETQLRYFAAELNHTRTSTEERFLGTCLAETPMYSNSGPSYNKWYLFYGESCSILITLKVMIGFSLLLYPFFTYPFNCVLLSYFVPCPRIVPYYEQEGLEPGLPLNNRWSPDKKDYCFWFRMYFFLFCLGFLVSLLWVHPALWAHIRLFALRKPEVEVQCQVGNLFLGFILWTITWTVTCFLFPVCVFLFFFLRNTIWF